MSYKALTFKKCRPSATFTVLCRHGSYVKPCYLARYENLVSVESSDSCTLPTIDGSEKVNFFAETSVNVSHWRGLAVWTELIRFVLAMKVILRNNSCNEDNQGISGII